MITDKILEQLEKNPEDIEGLLSKYPDDHQEIQEMALIIQGLKSERIERKIDLFKKEEKQQLFEDIEQNIKTQKNTEISKKSRVIRLSNTLKSIAAIFILALLTITFWWNMPAQHDVSYYYASGPSLQSRSEANSSDLLNFAVNENWDEIIKESNHSDQLNTIEQFYTGLANLQIGNYKEALPYFQKVTQERLPGYENDARFNAVICKWQIGELNQNELDYFLEDENNPHHQKAIQLYKNID